MLHRSHMQLSFGVSYLGQIIRFNGTDSLDALFDRSMVGTESDLFALASVAVVDITKNHWKRFVPGVETQSIEPI